VAGSGRYLNRNDVRTHEYDSVNGGEGLTCKYPAECKFILGSFAPLSLFFPVMTRNLSHPIGSRTDRLPCFDVRNTTHEFMFSRIGREPRIYEFLEKTYPIDRSNREFRLAWL